MAQWLILRKCFSAASTDISLYSAVFISEPAMFYGWTRTTTTIQLAFPSKEN
jgi:hypothetical protein